MDGENLKHYCINYKVETLSASSYACNKLLLMCEFFEFDVMVSSKLTLRWS